MRGAGSALGPQTPSLSACVVSLHTLVSGLSAWGSSCRELNPAARGVASVDQSVERRAVVRVGGRVSVSTVASAVGSL